MVSALLRETMITDLALFVLLGGKQAGEHVCSPVEVKGGKLWVCAFLEATFSDFILHVVEDASIPLCERLCHVRLHALTQLRVALEPQLSHAARLLRE